MTTTTEPRETSPACVCLPAELCTYCQARGYTNPLAGYAARIHPRKVTLLDLIAHYGTSRAFLAAAQDDPTLLTDYRAVIREMRDWVADCEWADDTRGLSDAAIILGVDAHYAGGIAAFLEDAS